MEAYLASILELIFFSEVCRESSGLGEVGGDTGVGVVGGETGVGDLFLRDSAGCMGIVCLFSK